nr:glycosyltransferase family 39 protein [Methanobacterium formicicum]
MGYVSVDVIFLISGLIFILGVIGLYLLLKERFDPTKSLAGSLIFISLPVIMAWAVSGGIDLPGVVFFQFGHFISW